MKLLRNLVGVELLLFLFFPRYLSPPPASLFLLLHLSKLRGAI